MTTDRSCDRAKSVFHHAATRTARTPTAALAQSLRAATPLVPRAAWPSPGTGSFDPPTAAALLARFNP